MTCIHDRCCRWHRWHCRLQLQIRWSALRSGLPLNKLHESQGEVYGCGRGMPGFFFCFFLNAFNWSRLQQRGATNHSAGGNGDGDGSNIAAWQAYFNEYWGLKEFADFHWIMHFGRSSWLRSTTAAAAAEAVESAAAAAGSTMVYFFVARDDLLSH